MLSLVIITLAVGVHNITNNCTNRPYVDGVIDYTSINATRLYQNIYYLLHAHGLYFMTYMKRVDNIPNMQQTSPNVATLEKLSIMFYTLMDVGFCQTTSYRRHIELHLSFFAT